MSRVKGKNTRPERVVRALVKRLGYRFRSHVRGLPGAPDLVFPSRKAVVFVSGCFWHRHDCFNGRRLPKTRARWWRVKLNGNRRRDLAQQRELRRLGWRVMVVWECQLRALDRVAVRIRRFLER